MYTNKYNFLRGGCITIDMKVIRDCCDPERKAQWEKVFLEAYGISLGEIPPQIRDIFNRRVDAVHLPKGNNHIEPRDRGRMIELCDATIEAWKVEKEVFRLCASSQGAVDILHHSQTAVKVNFEM